MFCFCRLIINIRIEVNFGILYWHSCQLTPPPPNRGSYPLQSAITPTCHHPRRTPKQKLSTPPPWPRICQMMLNKLDFGTISPCRRSKFKVLQTALSTWICLYFCTNKDNLDVDGLFPFHLVYYELEIYALKWFKKYKCMRKRSPRAMPPQQSSVGVITPPPPPQQHSQKLASMHWEMKGHGSLVNLWEAPHKIYTWPVFFDFPM